MQNSNTRTIRGLSIAVLVLSILAILGAIALVFLLAFTASLIPELVDETWEYALTTEELREFDELGLSEGSIVAILQSALGAAGVILFLFAACCVVCLVASILGLKNYNKVEKLGLVFCWSIAGAICAFCSAQLISAVLLIIMAVLINRVRNEARLQATYAQQSMPYTPYGQPQAPYTPYAPYDQAQQAPYAAYTATPGSAAPPYEQTAVFYGQPNGQLEDNQNGATLGQENSSQNGNS